MNNENTGGGWEVDKNGKRFRKVGNCIEYEMEYTFPRIKKDPEKESQALKEANEREARLHTSKTCPFKDGLNTECLTDCALYGKTACALTMKETPPDKDTSGGNCPIYRRQCNEKCALYFNGCGLINIVKGLNAGKEN